MTFQTRLGLIEIATDVFTSVSGNAANNCFGVKGMAARSMTDGFVYLLRRDNLAKGVKVTFSEAGGVCVELHIVVEHGVNIPAIGQSIISEVRYFVEKSTGVPVETVEVFVDSMVQ